MEDILALVVVLVVLGSVYAIGRIVYRSHKKHKAEQLKKEAERFQYSPKQWEPLTPQQYADAIPKPKRKPAMKKANYADTATASSTSTAGTLDFGDVVTGALVLNELFGHKSEPSAGVSISTKDDTPSWGLDDSDSRKSISSSMDSFSSWSDSSSSSSDSGPSSDW